MTISIAAPAVVSGDLVRLLVIGRGAARFAPSGPHARVRITDLALRDVARACPRVPVWSGGHGGGRGPEAHPFGHTVAWHVGREGLFADVRLVPREATNAADRTRLREGRPVGVSAEFSILSSRRAANGDAVVGAVAIDAIALLEPKTRGAWSEARVWSVGATSGILTHPSMGNLPEASGYSSSSRSQAWARSTCPPINSGQICEFHSTDQVRVKHYERTG
jgi:hypothetical protein